MRFDLEIQILSDVFSQTCFFEWLLWLFAQTVFQVQLYTWQFLSLELLKVVQGIVSLQIVG